MAIVEQVQLEHCGFVVPDLDAAVEFFTTWLGFEVAAQQGPWQGAADEITRSYAAPERAVGRSVLLTKGGQFLELRSWVAYGQGLNPLRESTMPGCHISLRIGDFDAVLAQLRQIPRMRVLEPAADGSVHCFTPFGVFLQLKRGGGLSS